ncbi:MAG: permease prefix domain 1-containing protein [Lysobacterales bacterium]
MPEQNSTQTFNLDAEITRWCDRLAGASADQDGGPDAEEMSDHLHCQVDEMISQGLDPATAFVRAIESLGDPAVLHAEMEKASGPQFTRAQIIRFVVGYLALTLIGAIAIVVTFGEKPYAEHMLAGIYLLLTPMLYFTARGRAAIQAECRMIKRVYRKLKT